MTCIPEFNCKYQKNRNKKHFLLFDTYIKSLLFLITPNININKILKCEKNSIFLEHLEVLNSFFFK